MPDPNATVVVNSNQHQARVLFEQAIGLPDPAERRAFLERACAGDEALRREVESLLAAYESCASFLKPSAGMALPRLPLQGPGVHSFGDYELLEEIARGGMGIVYKARQVSLNRTVAIKMILAGQLASEAEVIRFRSEAQAAASLSHPNIVGIHEVGERDGQHYYSMPFLEGMSLAQWVETGQWRPGDGGEAARLMTKIARAVQCAHDAGIVHRDLKPGNILLGPDGEPRVTDFGLAKQVKGKGHLTLTGNLMGTPSFMAPEQARGRSGQCSPASDIYSLGAVLYYLLTRHPPFVADSALDALLLVLEGDAVLPRRINPLVPGPLERICLRCLEKRPDDRYASAGELADDLELFLKGEALAGNAKSIGRQFETWTKRQPALAARFCTGFLCLVIIVVAYQVTAHQGQAYTSPGRHEAVIGVLAFWLAISFLCQWGVERERHAKWIRYIWSGVDAVVITTVLLIAQAFRSPLVILYPTLIAASGFWLRVSLVATTTVTSLVGYVVLLVINSYGGNGGVPFHRHVLAFVAIILTGISVAYLVNRVSAVTRFYEQRPRTKG